MDNTPPQTAELIYQKVSEITAVFDPYKEIKKSSIKEALEVYPLFKNIVNESNNRLLTAIRIAIAGNIIDYGINKNLS